MLGDTIALGSKLYLLTIKCINCLLVSLVPQRPQLRSWVNLAYSWKIAIVRDEYIRDPVVGKLTFAAFYESSGSLFQ